VIRQPLATPTLGDDASGFNDLRALRDSDVVDRDQAGKGVWQPLGGQLQLSAGECLRDGGPTGEAATYSRPCMAWFQSPPHTKPPTGNATISCWSARDVFSLMLPSPQSPVPQQRHGKMLLHQTNPMPSAAALAGCGSGSGRNWPWQKTPAQCFRSPILAPVRCDPNPGKDVSSRTSVSSHTSHS